MSRYADFKAGPGRVLSLQGKLIPYLWAVVAVALGVQLRLMLIPELAQALPFITLFPAIFVVAYVGGFGPTVLATFLSILAALYLFIEPVRSFALANPVAQLGAVLFGATGIGVGWLGEARLRALRSARAAVALAEREAARAEQEAVRAEEEAARAEEESARAEEEMLQAEEASSRAEQEARRAARESERVERILGSITDSFTVIDQQWTITYMNERAASMAGGTRQEFIGRNYWEAFPAMVGSSFEDAYRRAMAGEYAARVTGYYPPRDSWIEATAYPSTEGLTIVAQDVTARVRASELTARLAAIVSSSADAIVGKKLDGTVISWNTAAEEIFGYTADEMIGSSIYRLIPPDLHEAETEMLRRVARGEPVEFSEVERIRKDGQRIFIALTISPIKDPGGKVVGASSIKRDITAQKRVQAALEAESARSRELAQALDVSQALVRDLDGRVTYWSSGAARLYGYSAAEALGRNSHELLQTEFPLPLEEIRSGLQASGRWEGEVVHVAKDGRRIHVATQWVLQRRRRDDVPLVTEINTDVTAQRLIEERVRQTERMEVVGQLAGGVAHEANNQMTVVLGAASFLLGRKDLPESAVKDLEYIREAADRTAAITAQLLAFSRRQVIQVRVFDLDEVVQGLEGVLRRALGERSTLVLQLRANGRVKADPGQLTQVLLNLVLNARDAMPLGGRLTLETRTSELTEGYARRRPGVAIRPGKYAVIAVSDTGHGMGPETLSHLFEPFYTTKPVGKGTGLGLATVYGIVKQSGGYVWAYSEVGHGSTFKVYLPLDADSPVTATRPDAAVRASGETILLVEDEPSVRHMTSRALQEYGYGVVEASGGHQALGVLEREDGHIDLLITDVILHGMEGPELARRALELVPDLPLLFISGYTDDEVVRRGLLTAGQPFLQKPFTPEALARQVGELLQARRQQNRQQSPEESGTVPTP
jgi:two-component system, cell cycle sensor histidine kinase and response regulator CckA